MSKQAFISHYAKADGPFAQQLAHDLHNLGLKVWIAPQSIIGGESFIHAINRGLSTSDYFLLIVTPGSLGSRWVQAEIDAAFELELQGRIRIIPLEVRRSELPPLLLTKQIISFQGGYQQGFKELGKGLGFAEPAIVESLSHDEIALDLQGSINRDVDIGDPFIEGTLADLDRSMSLMGYFMNRVDISQHSNIRAIIESKASLQIGVSIHPDPDLRTNDLLVMISREITENYHHVAGIFAIQQGRTTEMHPYLLDNSATCNAMHVMWNEIDGREALGQAIALFFEVLSGHQGAV